MQVWACKQAAIWPCHALTSSSCSSLSPAQSAQSGCHAVPDHFLVLPLRSHLLSFRIPPFPSPLASSSLSPLIHIAMIDRGARKASFFLLFVWAGCSGWLGACTELVCGSAELRGTAAMGALLGSPILMPVARLFLRLVWRGASSSSSSSSPSTTVAVSEALVVALV